MNIKLRPTSTLLVGFLLIFFLSGLVSGELHPYASERLNAFKDISSGLCQHQESPKLGQLKIGEETINFPWAQRYIPSISPTGIITITRMPPAKDDIIVNGSNSNRELCGNFLGIDVSGITVSAINTVERGSAVATSNIIINPVQITHLAPEVEEKLK